MQYLALTLKEDRLALTRVKSLRDLECLLLVHCASTFLTATDSMCTRTLQVRQCSPLDSADWTTIGGVTRAQKASSGHCQLLRMQLWVLSQEVSILRDHHVPPRLRTPAAPSPTSSNLTSRAQVGEGFKAIAHRLRRTASTEQQCRHFARRYSSHGRGDRQILNRRLTTARPPSLTHTQQRSPEARAVPGWSRLSASENH